MACALSKDSDQPGHLPSLIKVFAVCMKNAWVLSYPLSAQWRIWSDWADAQADLSLCWAHRSCCWFCHAVAHLLFIIRIVCLGRTKFTIGNKFCDFGLFFALLGKYWTLFYIFGKQHSYLSPVMRKCVLCHMGTTKAQISLRIRAVWPAPLLFAV